jgi:hypothetical protein
MMKITNVGVKMGSNQGPWLGTDLSAVIGCGLAGGFPIQQMIFLQSFQVAFMHTSTILWNTQTGLL